jgi:hypothetical protein
MKKNYSRLVFGLVVLLGFAAANAQITRTTSKVGTTAAQFLKIGPGARAIGMGDAYSAVGTDIYSTYWNPAGIANSTSNAEVTFNHANWLADVNYDYAAAALNVPDMGTMFFTLTSLGVPEDKVRSYEYPEGDGQYWDAKSLAIGIGFARKLTDKFSIGFQAKYIREAIWNESASGFALDIGTYYITPFNDLVIGASISNFGTKMQLDGRDLQVNVDPNTNTSTGPNNIPANYDMGSYDIPLTFRLGLSMNVIKNQYVRVTAAVDATHPNDNVEYLNTGMEVAYDEMLFVRAGYKSLFLRDSEQGLSLGAGVKYDFDGFGVKFNYGWSDYGRLKNVQFIDVSMTF